MTDQPRGKQGVPDTERVTLYRFTGEHPSGWCGVVGDGIGLRKYKGSYETQEFVPASELAETRKERDELRVALERLNEAVKARLGIALSEQEEK